MGTAFWVFGSRLTIQHTALELNSASACEIFEFVDISIAQPCLSYFYSPGHRNCQCLLK